TGTTQLGRVRGLTATSSSTQTDNARLSQIKARSGEPSDTDLCVTRRKPDRHKDSRYTRDLCSPAAKHRRGRGGTLQDRPTYSGGNMDDRKTVLRLDGSYGTGDLVRTTVVTADRIHGKVDTVYEIPYAIFDVKALIGAMESKYILGYGVERVVPAGSKVVVLTTGEDGLRAEFDNGDEQ